MLKENNPLLEINLEVEKQFLIKLYQKYFEPLYELYILILMDPIENFYFEIISLFICHFQIILFIFNNTVSKLMFKLNLSIFSFCQFGIMIK